MTFQSLEMRGLAARRLRYAIVTSLLLHFLILWSGGTPLLTKDTPSLLQATLHKTSPPSAGQAPPAVLPAPTLAPPRPKQATQSMERSSPESFPQQIAAPADPVAPPPVSAEPAPAVAVAPRSVQAGSASNALLTEVNASGEAVDGLRGYRLAVASQARRFKRYPGQAIASGWAGSADIRIEVGSDGQPRAATVLRSSGHETLDRAALNMIDAGALRARLPESLRGKVFAVVLPVVFNLEEE